MINIERIELEISKRRVAPQNDFFGQEIRRQRKNLDLTLHESSKGICSMSYLSKIENNLIERNDEIVEKLLKKFKIEIKDQVSLEMFKEEFEKQCESLLKKENPKTCEFKGTFGYRYDLYQLSAVFVEQKQSRFSKSYYKLIESISYFSDYELTAFLFMCSFYLTKNGRHLDAYRLYEIAKDYFDDSLVSILSIYVGLKNRYFLGESIKGNVDYQKLTNELVKRGYFDFAQDLLMFMNISAKKDWLPTLALVLDADEAKQKYEGKSIITKLDDLGSHDMKFVEECLMTGNKVGSESFSTVVKQLIKQPNLVPQNYFIYRQLLTDGQQVFVANNQYKEANKWTSIFIAKMLGIRKEVRK